MKKKSVTEIGRRDFLRVVAITAGGGIIAACAPVAVQPTAAPGAQATAVPAATAASATTVPPTAAASGAPKPGGTLTLGSGQAAQQLDPHVSTFAYERLYYVGLYNGLTEFNPDMELVPSLAESWEASDDLMTYTFKLRPGVMFHNGRELTAEDIKWNYERVLDPALGSQIRNNVQEIETIEIVDPSTIRFNLSSPSVTLPVGAQELRIIAPESVENINKAPIGTGPFMYEDFVPDEHLYLTRFDDYWGPKPYLDRVQLVGIKDATAAFTALTTGTWDAMWNLSAKDASQLASSPTAIPLVPKVQSSNVFWELDTTSPPFDKVEARQALSYAVDRKSIAEVAYFGFAQPYYFNDPVPPDNWAFTTGMTDYQYDLDKAKELFTAAGVTEGTELTFWTVASQFPEWITAAEILQQSLAQIGITLKIEQNEIGTWVDKFYPSGKKYPGLIIPNGDTALLDPAFRLKFFSVDRCECNYNDPKIDELLAEGKSTADRAKRKVAYDEIQKIVNEQVPVIIPSSWPFLNANQNFVKDIWAESGGFIHYETAWLDK